MNDYRAQIREAARAVRILTSTTFLWFGKPSPPLPPEIRRAFTATTARNYLLYNLQSRLYTDFYCTGGASPASQEANGFSPPGDTPFVHQLSAANTSNGYWAGGWEVFSLEGDRVGLSGQGGRIWTAPSDCACEPGETLSPGGRVRVRFPKGSMAVSPGYYTSMSDNWLRPEESDELVRLYWNVTAEGASPLMGAITGALNSLRLPFRFKMLSHPERFARCDAGVLYVRGRDFPAVAEIVATVYAQVGPYLKSRTPALTKALAPGLGLAEEPGKGLSFGQHRCRLIAVGLVRAYEAGTKSEEAKLGSIEEHFKEDGLSLERPYLNRASWGDYAYPSLRGTIRPGTSIGTVDRDNVTPQAYLLAAQGIARSIVSEAIGYGGRCSWVGAEPQVNPRTGQHGIAHSALGPTLYTGTAGIALFLAELQAAAPDGEVRATAEEAMRHALSQLDRIDPEVRFGLYSGWAGIALAAARVGLLLGRAEFVEEAARVVGLLERQEPVRRYDLMSGKAGAVAALPVLSAYLGDSAPMSLARRLGDELLATASKSPWGYSWESSHQRDGPPLTGLSHGAAGAGYALVELWRATQDERYHDAALRAFEYERHWFDAREGNWPDFRLEDRETEGRRGIRGRRGNWPFATFWCNGAPGIGLSRLRAYQLLGDTTCRSEAVAALQTTANYIESCLETHFGNYSLCHGLAGNAETLVYGQQVLGAGWEGARPAATVVERVASHGIRRFGAAGERWPCGSPRGETPNLMIGLAGTGYFYLRLHNQAVPSILLVHAEEPVAGG